MTETSRQAVDADGETTTMILDEFRREEAVRTARGTVRILKPKRSFGRIGLKHITDCVDRAYRVYRESLNVEFGLDSLEACVNAFYVDRLRNLETAIEGGRITTDASFDRQVTTAAYNWVKGLFGRTDFGRKRDVIRKRMQRDPQNRFESHDNKKSEQHWGLRGGSALPTTTPTVTLKLATLQYPIDIDYRKIADPTRKREPSYGKKGQLENMLAGILQAAEGTLTATELLRIVQYRVTVLQAPRVLSMDANPESPLDFPDTGATDPSDAADAQEHLQRERLIEDIIQHFESLDRKDLARERAKWAPTLEILLGDSIIQNSGKALS
ncbi:hypothetical protein [Bifidobacterium callimiconis]|uniref:Uncharacterized protein n=1 Tax=Bifidobacterium callimiconis TaxID=2306973 RepID=A0A430FGW9_9BIFI|nr:hypothetical protein [Bifidobacterium callimiconis]RSX52022.1 hypothetical protein D2E23_0629 [Bifidobacterium callimiconis]